MGALAPKPVQIYRISINPSPSRVTACCRVPMLFSTGVLTGRISLEQFVALTSTNPAKLFGLYPQKGTLSVGADADLVLWNPRQTRSIDGSKMHSRSDFSPYDGWEVTGWPAITMRRGEVVARDGKVQIPVFDQEGRQLFVAQLGAKQIFAARCGVLPGACRSTSAKAWASGVGPGRRHMRSHSEKRRN